MQMADLKADTAEILKAVAASRDRQNKMDEAAATATVATDDDAYEHVSDEQHDECVIAASSGDGKSDHHHGTGEIECDEESSSVIATTRDCTSIVPAKRGASGRRSWSASRSRRHGRPAASEHQAAAASPASCAVTSSSHTRTRVTGPSSFTASSGTSNGGRSGAVSRSPACQSAERNSG